MSEESSLDNSSACANPDFMHQSSMLHSISFLAKPKELKGKVTCFSFNEKATRFVVGTTLGYFVYDVNRRTLLFSKVLDKAVGIAELLGNTNLVILSGYVSRDCLVEPISDEKVLLFWNDETNSQIDKKPFSNTIKKVKIRRERIYVSYGNKIDVYAAKGLVKLTTIDSISPPIFDISYQGDFTLVCVDEKNPKAVRVWKESLEDLRRFKCSSEFSAQRNNITAIAVSPNNSLYATVSDGKNIHLSRMDGENIHDLYRGHSEAGIRAMAFSPNGSLVAIISSNGTCHVFEISYKFSYLYSHPLSGLYDNFKCGEAKYLAFSSDSTKLIVASESEVELHSVFLDKEKSTLKLTKVGNYNFVDDKREGSMFVK